MSGVNNVVAHALSRIESIETIDYKKLAEAQNCDDKHQSMLKENTSALTLMKINYPDLEVRVYCDMSYDKIIPYVQLYAAQFSTLYID